MRRQPFGDTDEREAMEVELFLSEYNVIEPGGPWIVLSHEDRPDFRIISETRGEERRVEITLVYLNNKSVIREHVRRMNGPIPIPYDAGKVERYKRQLVQAVETKCHRFKRGFGTNLAILSLYLNDYIAIYLAEEDLLELLLLHLPRVAGSGPFNQIVLWGGCPLTPVIYYRDEIAG